MPGIDHDVVKWRIAPELMPEGHGGPWVAVEAVVESVILLVCVVRSCEEIWIFCGAKLPNGNASYQMVTRPNQASQKLKNGV